MTVVYESDNVSVTDLEAILRGQRFQIAEIASVSYYDEGAKAKRWLIGGFALLALAIVIGLPQGRGVGSFGAFGLIALLLGGGFIVLQSLRPSQGVGIVLEKTDGGSEIVSGLPRDEVPLIVKAIADLIEKRDSELAS